MITCCAPSIQARRRKHPSLPARSGRPIYVEHEYTRFERLVAQVMRKEPYRSARRVYWIVDNGSSHRGQRAANRLRAKWPNIVLVHTPVHASWLNQIEVYFSIVQRKLLTPNDFSTLAALKADLMHFQQHYKRTAKPFEWTFTRRDLYGLLARLRGKPDSIAA